jgi:tetratricopeptide (TPR) repeat protein/DNA-binding CsgD family transcriptional regulator
MTEELQRQLRATRDPARKVEIYIQACREIQYTDPEAALVHARAARKVARAAKLVDKDIHAQRMEGICRYVQYRYDEAIEIFSQALKRAEKMKDRSVVARTHQNIGLCLRALGRVEEALHSYRLSEQLLRELHDDDVLKLVLTNIGTVYSLLRQPSAALQAYSECLAIAQRTSDRYTRAQAMVNIANVYIDLDDNERGMEWSKRALEIQREIGQTEGVIISLMNIGRIHHAAHDHNAALAYYTECMSVATDANDAEGITRSLFYLSQLYLDRQQFAQAKDFAEQARARSVEMSNVDREARSLMTLGLIDVELRQFKHASGLYDRALECALRTSNSSLHIDILRRQADLAIATKQPGVAIKLLTTILSVATEHENLLHQAEAHKLLSELMAAAKKHADAYRHLQASFELQRKADAQIHAKHSQALQWRLEMERAERERAVVQLQNDHLSFQLESKQRELNGSAISLAQKNELLTSILQEIQAISQLDVKERGSALRALSRQIEQHLRSGEDWKNLSDQLRDVHDDFLKAVTDRCPTITPAELKIVSLLKLNLATKEMADILTMSVKSVEIYRHRIRKKLGIPASTALSAYFQTLTP